ncbi:acetyl-CoA carboxylase biotin carboxyl carrier protein subunit [Desulfomarina profundi]|uniref:Acetyl-CoA carboxylase biotin carboxyl carrier protein subunit n=1 Tax=Desulfomarina profundi TaxID=2772557 RepID=A0A8D5JNQ2_9BACT|nr:biotin/lipoyl-containing protein [Desulfomarina profundi]BCL60395.1 acetyl-CoA carboxylase biotin carboxyl carrier protein subunit [Desulfomarina profundi]
MKLFRVVVNDVEYRVGIEELQDESTPTTRPASSPPATAPTTPMQHPAKPAASPAPKTAATETGLGGNISAPMPGTVISILVGQGSSVKKGETLLVLEAMKMENDIKAPSDGTVQEIKASEGASVNAGDILIVLTP